MATPNNGKLQVIVVVILLVGVSLGIPMLSFFDLALIFPGRIPSYHYSGQFGIHILSSRAEKIDVGFRGDAPFIWMASLKNAMTRNFSGRLDVINPIEKKLVISLSDEQLGSPAFSVRELSRCGEYFATAHGGDLQLRAADGELVENNETLAKKFPELGAGIGKAEKPFARDNYFLLTTKDGFQYWYFPQQQILLTEQQYHEKEKKVYAYDAPMDTTDKDYELQYMWGLSKKTDGVRQQLYLTEKYHLSLAPDFRPASLERLFNDMERFARDAENSVRKSRQNERLRSEKLVMVASDVFLDGKILASDSRYCVVLHSQTIENGADKILSCVNREGKMLWQIVAPKFKTFEEAGSNDLSGIVGKNAVAIVNNAYRNRAACGLDIQTGKLLWEFSAF
jgi:hypothetical protein